MIRTLVEVTIKESQATSNSKLDSVAQFTIRTGKTHYVYKGLIGMDEDTNVIHTVEFTAANVHDSNKFDDLILGTVKRVHANEGCAIKDRQKQLTKRGFTSKILHKG